MFAKRGSSLSLKKLPCLGNALLTLCCLLVIITDVSSMSLNRLARQYQQQNDKLLDINKILLPEAESEMLQNNVEIVPALDGNSDMYLLVPATALNQEQNLQSLTAQLSDAQHADDNIEINSDMLMLESDDTPIVQILKVPEEVLETNKITQENDLMNEQNSADMLNSIAEAAQEIENEIETELMGSDENSKQEELVEKQATKQQEGSYSINESEDNEMEKVLENENSEQEMIGVVMEEANDNSAETGSVKKVLTAQELRQQNAAATKTEIEKTETEENVSGSELMQQSIEQVNGNMETEMEASKQENNLEDMAVEQDSKSEKLQDIPNEMLTEAVEEIKMESQAVEQNKDKENMPADDNETLDTDESQNEEVEDIKAEAADDLSVKKHQAEEINSEEIPNVMAVEKHESEVINNERPTSSIETQAVEDLQIVNDIPEFLQALETESLTNAEADNTGANENINESSKEEAQEIDQFESTTSALISENDDFNTVNEKEVLASEMNEKQMQNEKENQAVAEIQKLTDQKYDDEVKQAEDLMTNIAAEEAATVEKDVQVSDETLYIEETEKVKETASSEEAKPDKEIQFSEAADDTTEPQTAEEIQFYEVIPQKPEDALTGEQSAEEVQHQEEMQDAEVVEEAQSTEQTESLEDMQSDFISNFKPVEDISTEIDNQNSTEEETFLEDNKQNAEDDNATAETLEASQEVDASSDDSYVVPDSVTETLFSAIEENKIDEHVTQQPEAQELANEQQQEPEPLNTISEHNVAQAILTNMAAVVADKENAKLPEESGVTQNPSEHNDSDNESENVKQTTPTVMQIPTKEEQLTQQEHIENAQQQQQQPLAVHTIGSTTLKPLNVLNNVLNYVNASFMNQMNTDNNNNNENYIKQEIKEKETQVFNTKLRRYDGAQVWRIVVQNDKERKLADELQTKFDGQLWKEVKQEVDYLLKPQVLADAEQHVRAANLSRIVLIDNLQKVIEVENPPAEKIAQLQNRKGYRLTWEAYHRLEDIHGFFDYLAKTYPDICTVETIGYSLQKRPLKILKISNGNASNPGIWIDGGMHAREWISPSVVTYIANQIAEGWDDLPLYMRNINWYLHAVANPDGYEYSHTTDRLWRKNLRSHGRACPGVDLNRNFGYKWGGKGTSANPCSQTYRGSKAFSEPETFYISKFISNFPRETFKAYLSFHSYGQYILYPWGYDYHITNDMSDLDLLARQAGTIITKSTGAKFTVGSSATTLYPAAGGSDDWAKGIAGIKYSYTIEMGDTGRYGFVLPAEYIEPNGKNGLTFVQTIAKAITMGKNARRSKLKFRLNH